jgi:signal transduction histidine kinase
VSELSKVLVIDDDPAARRAVSWALGSQGYLLEEASSGTQALEKLRSFQPDVIISDIVLPDMDGLVLLRYVNQQKSPALVVLITAFGSQQITVEALRAGAYDYLSKPIQVDELRFIVRNAAEKQKLVRQNQCYVKGMEELLQKLKQSQAELVQAEKIGSLGRLVAGVAHEINTPLGALQSSTDTIERAAQRLVRWSTQPEPHVTGGLRRIVELLATSAGQSRTACERINAIVCTLREFAQLDRAEFQCAQIHDGIESTLALLGHELEHIQVTREFGELPDIQCDPRQLNQMFMNLLLNAKEAIENSSERGVIVISTSAGAGVVRVVIRDNGPGIPADQIARIFDPGFTTKGVQVGVGLGLPICYQIVQRHRGRIEVESRPGEGTELIVTLPISR